jgi:hypothetical protein
MPSYDPQRSRRRQRIADDEGPAPVDALLGPTPDAPPDDADGEPARTDTPAADLEATADLESVPVPEPAPTQPAGAPVVEDDTVDAPAAPAPAASAPAETTRREPLVIDLDAPAPVNVPRHRGRIVLYALAVLSLVAQVLAFRWWRRRRAEQRAPRPS